jgi:hypothetical protein
LKLPEGAQIHPVFHISQLKPFTADYTPVFEELPRVTDLSITATTPEAVLERRLVKKGNVAVPQVKVKWMNLSVSAATWEDMYVLRQRFPNALAWGQAGFQGGRRHTGEDMKASTWEYALQVIICNSIVCVLC